MVRVNRGRGGRSGRGSRGRCGRGGNRGQSGVGDAPASPAQVEDTTMSLHSGGEENKDISLRNLFLTQTTFSQHADAQNEDSSRYLACLYVLIKNNIQLCESSKAFALAAFWARKDFKKASFVLQIPGEMFALKEVLKAVTLLDTARNKRAQEKLLRRLEVQGCKKKKKMAVIKQLIGSLQTEAPTFGTLSGALFKQVKKWVQSIPADRLQFFALHFPVDPWKKLADLCHLHPEKDFPQCPWFLPFCFGKPIPDEAISTESTTLTEENVSEVLLTTDVDYTVVRKFKEKLTSNAKERVATYSPIDTVLWYYEELACDEVDKVLECRLSTNEIPTLSYGKLMERILHFANITSNNYSWGNRSNEVEKEQKSFNQYLITEADNQLKNIKFNLEPPVSVIGDMSGSMGVAIKTSNIIASLVTAVSNADLAFFDTENVIPSVIPKDVQGVLTLCKEINARGGTSPAVSLYPYYETKKIIKTFVMVTDEGENGKSHGENFSGLFKKYYHEVYPARLIFISFIGQTDQGQMVKELKTVAPEIKVLQFRFNGSRPDLSKLDNVFGLLSSESEAFSKELDEFSALVNEEDISLMLQKIKV